MLTKQVTWGEALVVKLHYVGGLRGVVDHIRELMGETIGTRNTFAKLLKVDDPADINDRDRWRAWLLLTTLGLDADNWGLPLNDVPVPGSITDIPALQNSLLLPSLQPIGCGTHLVAA